MLRGSRRFRGGSNGEGCMNGTTETRDTNLLEDVLCDRGDAFPVGAPPHEPIVESPPSPVQGPMTQRRVLGLAMPIIGENFLQTLVGAADTFMVAHLGSAAVAGVGTAIEIVFFLLAILSAIDIGATVLVSQAIGAGERTAANRFARQAVVWGILLAIPLSVVGVVAAPAIIHVFGAEPAVTAAAVTYLRVTAATSVALLLSFVCGAVLRGAGDSRTPLYAAVVANVINVAAAYVLIFGKFGLPELGVAGSALGAAIARAVGAGLMLLLMFGGKKAISLRGRADWRPNLAVGRDLMRLGVPSAIEQVLMSGGFTTLMAVVATIGTAALAAQQIGFTALSLAFLPGFGFAIACTALVGQSIGADDPAAARAAQRISMRWAVAWMTVGGVIYFTLAPQAMALFTSDPEVIRQGVQALRALSFALPFWAISFVNAGALRGSGDTRSPMVVSAVGIWLAVLLAWLGVRHFGAELGFVWGTFVITSPLTALANWLLFRRRAARAYHQPYGTLRRGLSGG
jgi:putative MATE family efflux protein